MRKTITDAQINPTTEPPTVGAIEWLDDQAKRSLSNNFQRFMWSPAGCEWCAEFLTVVCTLLVFVVMATALIVLHLVISSNSAMVEMAGLLAASCIVTALFTWVGVRSMRLVKGPNDEPIPERILTRFESRFPDLARQVVKDFPVDESATWGGFRGLVEASIKHNEVEQEAARNRAAAGKQLAALSSN